MDVRTSIQQINWIVLIMAQYHSTSGQRPCLIHGLVTVLGDHGICDSSVTKPRVVLIASHYEAHRSLVHLCILLKQIDLVVFRTS